MAVVDCRSGEINKNNWRVHVAVCWSLYFKGQYCVSDITLTRKFKNSYRETSFQLKDLSRTFENDKSQTSEYNMRNYFIFEKKKYLFNGFVGVDAIPV